MTSINSIKRQQYFQNRTEVSLPSGVRVQIRYLEVYPESIGIFVPNRNQNELVVLIGEELEKFLSGKTIDKIMDDEGKFMEQVILEIDNVSVKADAEFELVLEEYVYFIKLIYIA